MSDDEGVGATRTNRQQWNTVEKEETVGGEVQRKGERERTVSAHTQRRQRERERSGCDQTSRSPPPTTHDCTLHPQSVHHPPLCIHHSSSIHLSCCTGQRDMAYAALNSTMMSSAAVRAHPSLVPTATMSVIPQTIHMYSNKRGHGIALTYHDSCREAATAHAHVARHHSNLLHLYSSRLARKRRSVRCCGAQPAEKPHGPVDGEPNHESRAGRDRPLILLCCPILLTNNLIIISFSYATQTATQSCLLQYYTRALRK